MWLVYLIPRIIFSFVRRRQRLCCSVTSRILEIPSVSSKFCFFHPEFVRAFRHLSTMFRFKPPLFVLAPHDLNLAKFRWSRLLTVLSHVYIWKLLLETFFRANEFNCYYSLSIFHANHFKRAVEHKQWLQADCFRLALRARGRAPPSCIASRSLPR